MPLPTIIALAALPSAWLLERRGWLRPSWKQSISQILLRFCYPALIFGTLSTRVQSEELTSLWLLPASVAMLLLLGENMGRRWLSYSGLEDEKSRRSFRFLAILPNYSYLPLLLAQSLWGERGVALVVLSSVGADLVLWTRSVGVLQKKGGRRSLGRSLRRLLSPPLLSLLLALVLITEAGEVPKAWLEPVFPWLSRFGLLTLPLSMFLLGAHLGRPRGSGEGDGRAQALLLVWRLALVPALVFALLWALPLSWPKPAPQILLLIASMPGAIVSVILSEVYEASPDFAARQVLWGHLAWLVSGPAWLWLGRLL